MDISDESGKLYQECIERYGEQTQKVIAMEEFAELIQAISKTIRYPKSIQHKSNFVEEIADAQIMLEQLFMMLDEDDIVYYTQFYKRQKMKLRDIILVEKEFLTT